MKRIVVMVVALALAGCGNPVNLRTAQTYHEAGERAEAAGDYARAEQNYDRALLNAKLAHAPNGVISGVQYNLGRVKGYQCKLAEAETLLVESLKLEEKVTGPESEITTMRLFELGRLHYDQGQFDKAVTYYERGLPAVRRLGVASSDPIMLANATDEYAHSLSRVGRDAEARSAQDQAKELRARNPGKRANFVPVRYRCTARTA